MDDDNLLTKDQYENAVRLADEGVPVRAIARALNAPSADVRAALTDALRLGLITEIPKDDWPAGMARGSHLPMINGEQRSEAEMLLSAQRVLGLTPLEANFVVVLLKRDEVDRKTLHRVVEHQRMVRNTRPNDLEPTNEKIVDVVICKLRKKLSTHEIEITTLWGSGYYMPEDSRCRVTELVHASEIKTCNGRPVASSPASDGSAADN